MTLMRYNKIALIALQETKLSGKYKKSIEKRVCQTTEKLEQSL